MSSSSQFFGEKLIHVEGVGKKFSRNLNITRKRGVRAITRQLLGMPPPPPKLHQGEFWAAQDISFELRRGESLALLGLNGSGKSTLLKMIHGLILPDRGEIRVRGKMDALIELSSGFHPMLSGKENVLLKCALNGLSRKEALNLFDRIVDFSELEDFIHMPVKNYSSGMYARLGFATAIFGNPDILLVDEVLSVGDFRFRQKCLDKINEMKKNCAVIFVSHAMGTVKLFCDRALVMEKGKVLFSGPTDDATQFYLDRYEKKKEIAPQEPEQTHDPAYGDFFHNPEKIEDVKVFWATEDGTPASSFDQSHQKLYLHYSFRLKKTPQKLIMGIPVWNSRKEMISAFSSDTSNTVFSCSEDNVIQGRLEIENVFNDDNYQAVLAIVDGPEYYYRQPLSLLRVTNNNARDIGSVRINHRWLDPNSKPEQVL